jgi:hypothetical protein
MGVTTRRWRRYGHDRTYVADGETTLGYRDEKTGVVHVAAPERAAEVRAALGVAAAPPAPPGPVAAPLAPVPVPDPVDTPSTPVGAPPASWLVATPPAAVAAPPAFDLGARRAGTGARELAARAVAEHPVKTRVARLLRIHTPERAWRRGAEGEERVEARLRKLPPTWRELHDLPMGKGNVDHLVIGPGGVFSLNTKNLTGRVWVGAVVLHNGVRTDYVRNSRHEAAAVATRLSRAVGHPVEARGVLVIMCDDLTVKAQPDGVVVLRRLALLRWLKKRPIVLAPEEVVALYRAACGPATWLAGRH